MDLFFYEFKQSPEGKAIKEPFGLGDNVRGNDNYWEKAAGRA